MNEVMTKGYGFLLLLIVMINIWVATNAILAKNTRIVQFHLIWWNVIFISFIIYNIFFK